MQQLKKAFFGLAFIVILFGIASTMAKEQHKFNVETAELNAPPNEYKQFFRGQEMCFTADNYVGCFQGMQNKMYRFMVNGEEEPVFYEVEKYEKNKLIIVKNDFQKFTLLFNNGKLVIVKQTIFTNEQAGIIGAEYVYRQSDYITTETEYKT